MLTVWLTLLCVPVDSFSVCHLNPEPLRVSFKQRNEKMNSLLWMVCTESLMNNTVTGWDYINNIGSYRLRIDRDATLP